MPEGVSERLPRLRPKARDRERELTDQEKEIKGVWESIQFVDRLAKNKKVSISEQSIKQIQARVMGYYNHDIAGKYREGDLEISDSSIQPVHHTLVRGEMLIFGRKLEERTKNLDKSVDSMEKVIDAAAWAHYQLVSIHPFEDGNGRTSRQLVDLILKRGGMYYITDWGNRDNYINALEMVGRTRDTVHLKRFLAARLGARYDRVFSDLIKSRSGQAEKNSPVLADLLNRKQWLGRIATS